MALCMGLVADAGQGPSASLVPAARQVPDEEAIAVLAQCEAAIGHVDSSRGHFRGLLQSSNLSWQVRLTYARACPAWGDFLSAEKVLREHVRAFPADTTSVEPLAGALAAAQQFEAAEGVYEQGLLKHPGQTRWWLALVGVKMAQRDHEAALRVLERGSAEERNKPEARAVQAEVYLRLGRYSEAEESFKALALTPERRTDGMLGLGRVFLARREKMSAVRVFEAVTNAAPSNVAARFYVLQANDAPLSAPERLKPAERVEWARLCREYGQRQAAIECLQKAIAEDGLFFPAELALAQTLAEDRQFDRSISVYRRLLDRIPESYAVQLELARTLSWSRQYDEAISLYEALAQQSPGNPVPLREVARVAGWARRPDKAREYYDALLTPPVDSRLCVDFSRIQTNNATAALRDVQERLQRLADSGPPYDGFEWLCGQEHAPETAAAAARHIQQFRIALLPQYRIQKATYLEREAKRLTARKHYWRALEASRELTAFEPGNQEAMGDRAQLELALGLKRDARETTARILELNPGHNLAPLVLNRMDQTGASYGRLGADHWRESGRGGLMDVRRDAYEASVGASVCDRGAIDVSLRRWEERFGATRRTFRANGVSVQGRGVLTDWLRADGGLTHKNYVDAEASDTDTGYAEVAANVRDVATLAVRAERTDELYNEFGLRQNARADSWWLKARSDLSRVVEADGFGRLIDYSDGNEGQQLYLRLACSATEHPRILKGGVIGELRDTREATAYVYEGARLADIVHPYWTPRNYGAWGVMAEWYHDLSAIFLRGTELRYYHVMLTLRDDTERNPSVELKGRLHWECADRWIVGLAAAIQRSSQWTSDGVWVSLQRHF